MCRKLGGALVLAALLTLGAPAARASVEINFEGADGDAFDGDGAGDMTTVQGFTFTTQSVGPNNGTLSKGFELGVDSSGSGMDSSTSAFNENDAEGMETWEFTLGVPIEFEGIDIAALSTNESIMLQSDAWIGLMGVVPASGNISFDMATGKFTFTDVAGTSDDDYDLNDLTGGVVLPVAMGTSITFGFFQSSFDQFGDNAGLQSIRIKDATPTMPPPPVIPEPGTIAIWSILGVVGLFGWRRRRARKA